MAKLSLRWYEMETVTINDLFGEIRLLRREVNELRSVFIPEEKISPAERRELDALFREIEGGKGIPWRKALKK